MTTLNARGARRCRGEATRFSCRASLRGGGSPSLWRIGSDLATRLEARQRQWLCPLGLQGTVLRAVRVRPEFVRGMRALDLNVVLQREEGPAEGKFDLLIATNILVYYDTFEQSLALANVQTMLRPGGFLLTNNLLLELPSSKMKSGDYVSVEYSTRETDGDQIVWYRREH